MNLLDLPYQKRHQAYESIMRIARSMGLHGMAGECGELAVAMNRVLFDGKGELIGGLNAEFEKHGKLVGHFVVRVDDERLGCINLDERGIPIPDEQVESWGMLDPTDGDFKQAARELGFALTDATAGETCMLVFEDEKDVLINMPGTGLDKKIEILSTALAQYNAGIVNAPSTANDTRKRTPLPPPPIKRRPRP